MKSFAHKLIAFTFVIALAAGCGSVTDAGLEVQDDQPEIEQPVPQADNPEFGSESDMEPIVDAPEE